MNNKIAEHLNFERIALLSILILITSLVYLDKADAQSRRGHKMRREPAPVRIMPRFRNYTPVFVGSRRYYYNHGVFYRRAQGGYRVIPAPIGARIRYLPAGFLTLTFGGLNYYCYNGVYYSYLPGQDAYVVVEKPANSETMSNLKLDQVKLYDGTTLQGVFQSGTDSTITLRVGNQDRDIYINNIISIFFAPSINDTSQSN